MKRHNRRTIAHKVVQVDPTPGGGSPRMTYVTPYILDLKERVEANFQEIKSKEISMDSILVQDVRIALSQRVSVSMLQLAREFNVTKVKMRRIGTLLKNNKIIKISVSRRGVIVYGYCYSG